MKKPQYRKIKPTGKCAICTISLWKEHEEKPAPHTMPCLVAGCPHKTSAKIISFDRSTTGSSLLMITG